MSNSATTSNAARDTARTDTAEVIDETGLKPGWLAWLASRRIRRLSREFAWIGLGQAAAVIGTLWGVRLLTGLLAPETYGQLALGMTIATLVNQVVLGPLSCGATRFFAPSQEAGSLQGCLTAVRTLAVQATGLIVLAALALCLALLFLGQSAWVGLVLAAVFFALLSGYNAILSGMQNAARQRAVVALHQGLASWGRFLLAAGMIVWLGAGSAAAMLGYALAVLVVVASQAWFFRRTVSLSGDGCHTAQADPGPWRARILSYIWPLAVWGIPGWAQLASGRWALQTFASTEDVGLYAVVYQLGYYPVTLVTGLVVQLVAPVFFQRAGDASEPTRVRHVHRLNSRLVTAALVLTGLAVLLAFGLHRAVFRWLVASEYHTVSWLLPWMVLAGGVFASGELAAVSLLSGTQTHSLLAPKVTAAAMGVLLSLFGAVRWGIPGVVAASAVASTIYLLWLLLLVRTWHHRRGKRENDDVPAIEGVA